MGPAVYSETNWSIRHDQLKACSPISFTFNTLSPSLTYFSPAPPHLLFLRLLLLHFFLHSCLYLLHLFSFPLYPFLLPHSPSLSSPLSPHVSTSLFISYSAGPFYLLFHHFAPKLLQLPLLSPLYIIIVTITIHHHIQHPFRHHDHN